MTFSLLLLFFFAIGVSKLFIARGKSSKPHGITRVMGEPEIGTFFDDYGIFVFCYFSEGSLRALLCHCFACAVECVLGKIHYIDKVYWERLWKMLS